MCFSDRKRLWKKANFKSRHGVWKQYSIVFDTFGKCNNGPLNPSTHMPFKIYGLEGDITFPG